MQLKEYLTILNSRRISQLCADQGFSSMIRKFANLKKKERERERARGKGTFVTKKGNLSNEKRELK